jgi:hypothetical protein
MDDNSATAQSAQDVTSRIEQALYPETAQKAEPVVADDEEVVEDADELPDTDDSKSEEDEGSEDEPGDEFTDEELSLAAYLGVDEDRLIVGEDGQVMLNAIIDGETKAVPLKELAASYQLQGHVNNKSMALENERKEFEATRTNVVQGLQQRVEGVTKLASAIEDELIGDYKRIDWDALRASDPSEWSALRQEYAERARKIEEVKNLAIEESKRIQTEIQQKQMEAMQNHIAEQRAKMIEKNPEWADVNKRKEALVQIKSFLSSTYGYSESDAENISDARLVELVKDAMAYRQGKKAVETKKVKVVPKFQKPGASRIKSAQLAKARDIKAKKAAVRKSGGSIDSVANALLDRM